MDYAKLNNGKLSKLVRFPNGMSILDGKFKLNPTEEEILSAGYLPMEEQPEPDTRDDFVKSSRWVQTETAIVRKWTVLPDRRPMSQNQVSRMVIAQQINALTVDDNTALRMKSFYPAFDSVVGQTVKNGFKFTDGDKLWRVIQPELTLQAHYRPGVDMESLYTEVCETHSGTLDDPIPYNGNMALENGRYYVQGNVIYLCNRDTGNPVYHALSELVGLYVEEM